MSKQQKTKYSKRETDSVAAASGKQQIPRTWSLHIRPWFYWVVFGLLLLCYGYFRLRFLEAPLERDEGSYAYIGKLILEGKKPYLDFYEMKLPGLFYTYALLTGIFGVSLQGLHWAILVVCLLTALFLYLASAELFGRGVALMAPLCYLSMSLAAIVTGYTAQAEHVVSFYLSIGYYFAVLGRTRKNFWYWAGAGVFLVNAIMVKQIGLLLSLPVALLALDSLLFGGENRTAGAKQTAKNIGGLLLGGAVMALFWLGLVAIQGGWQEMWFWVVEYPKQYTSVYTWGERKAEFYAILSKYMKQYGLFWFWAGVGIVAGLFSKKTRFFVPFVLLSILSALAATLPGYYFYNHYWIYLAPMVALGAVLGLSTLTEQMRRWTSPGIATLFAGGLLLGTFLWDFMNRSAYYTVPNIKAVMYQVYTDNPFPETLNISKEIKKRAQPNDQLLVMGSEPQMYVYTGLPCPTRHFFMGFLAKNHPREAEWIAEAKKDAETSMPRFLVYVVHPYSWAYVDNKKTDMFSYAFEFARMHYRLIGLVDMLPQGSKYLWDKEVDGYPMPKDKHIRIYERKSE